MKATTKLCLAGILCLTSAGMVKADANSLFGAANDASAAIKAENLDNARNLSGKFIDGSMNLQSPSPVQIGTQNGSKADRIAAPSARKATLKAEVPAPAPAPAPKPESPFHKTGVIRHLTDATLALIFTPINGTITGANAGKKYGADHAGKAGLVVGLVIGAVIGLAIGVVGAIVRSGISLYKAGVALYHGRF